MKMLQLGEKIGQVLRCSLPVNRQFDSVHWIINPHAGFLRNKRFVARTLQTMDAVIKKNNAAPLQPAIKMHLHYSRYPNDEKNVLQTICSRILPDQKPVLILSIGGDGTHQKIAASLMTLDETQRKKIVLFRLPFGTGNDASDAASIEAACTVLLQGFTLKTISCIKIFFADKKEPEYSFNIASIGIDAFIVDKTNRLKNFMPGNSYKIMVDLSTLFYEWFCKVSTMRITDMENNITAEGKFILAVFGVSGGRTYGSHVRILPDDHNICAVQTMPLWKKIQFKKLFYQGTHILEKETTLLKSRQFTIDYASGIYFQADGEVLLLKPSAFPIKMNIEVQCIRVLGY